MIRVSSAILDGYAPATWRGMTGMPAGQLVAGITFTTFDGNTVDLALTDIDLRRMVRQVVETVPARWAVQLRPFFQDELGGTQ